MPKPLTNPKQQAARVRQGTKWAATCELACPVCRAPRFTPCPRDWLDEDGTGAAWGGVIQNHAIRGEALERYRRAISLGIIKAPTPHTP